MDSLLSEPPGKPLRWVILVPLRQDISFKSYFPQPFGSPNASPVLCCAVLGHSVMSDSLRTHRLQPTRLLCPWGFFRQEYWSRLPCPPPGHLPHAGIEPRSPSLRADSFLSDPPGKPQNIGVGSYPYSRSQPRAQTRISCIAGRFFTS